MEQSQEALLNTGKSGGARVVTHLKIEATVIYLVSIYDKSEQENISDERIKDILNKIE